MVRPRRGSPEAIPAIARRLEKADWQDRRHLIRALATMQSARTLPLLVSAVTDEYAHIRLEAVEGLRRLGTPEALATLRVGSPLSVAGYPTAKDPKREGEAHAS